MKQGGRGEEGLKESSGQAGRESGPELPGRAAGARARAARGAGRRWPQPCPWPPSLSTGVWQAAFEETLPHLRLPASAAVTATSPRPRARAAHRRGTGGRGGRWTNKPGWELGNLCSPGTKTKDHFAHGFYS